MGNALVNPSDRCTIVGSIDPDAASAATYTTDWADMVNFESVLAVIQTGTLGGTIDAKLEQATDVSGTGAKDVTDKAITQLGDDGKQALINCRGDEFDVNGNFRFVRLSITVAAGACDCSGLLLGFDAHYGPASLHAAASVAETV